MSGQAADLNCVDAIGTVEAAGNGQEGLDRAEGDSGRSCRPHFGDSLRGSAYTDAEKIVPRGGDSPVLAL